MARKAYWKERFRISFGGFAPSLRHFAVAPIHLQPLPFTLYPFALTSPLQQVDLVRVDRLLIPKQRDDQAQADRGLGGGVGNDENGERLAVHRMEPLRKR